MTRTDSLTGGADILVCPSGPSRDWSLSSLFSVFLLLTLIALSARAADAPPKDYGKITIDVAARGEPMSPLIYSQFIEHLGRCIYGGIWAEMLEDRKFYYPITPEYKPYTRLAESPFPVVGASPWEIIGAAGGVQMSESRAFVGKHSPVLTAGTAIRQRDLGVVNEQQYTGYVWLAANDEGTTAEVTLWWGAGNAKHTVTAVGITPAFKLFPVSFTAAASTDKAMFEIRAVKGAVCIGAASLMPADNVEGMRADTLALLKELNAPIYRWPGGNFVSGYDWRDGVGDRDRRPPRTNPAWTGVEHNDFGMHEFIRFCQLIKTEPWITVNTGFGDAYSAANQLEYANGAPDTYWGAKRAANGAKAPFAVKYWGVGNEMWGPWQLGYMKLEHYVIKQNWVVDKMREVDPKIITISSGNAGPWSTGLLKNCANHMDWIAEHFYTKDKPDTLAHIRQMNDAIRKKADFHRQARKDLPNLAGKDIKIAMTEWNYWYGPHVYGELGTRYFLKDALGVAAGLHEFARQSDIIGSAFYAQTVNVIGCIKTTRTAASFDSTGLVLKLYRQELGTIPVKTIASAELDVQALLTADSKYLTIGIVNPSEQDLSLPLEVSGAKLGGTSTVWRVLGENLMSSNDPGQPSRVNIVSGDPITGNAVKAPPRSITLVKIPIQ